MRDRGAERSVFVGLLEKRGRFLVAEPFFERGSSQAVDANRDARPGRLALIGPGKGGRRSKVLRLLGRPDVARDALEALMVDRGLARRFGPGIERAAAEAVARVEAEDPAPARRDLRDLATFTIDPATAKDFDDAISAEALDGGRARVWVHIADVSAYVRPGSPVDREAYRRATSVYVPALVEPMLPEVLSNGACSLVPGQERRAVTVELELDGPDVVKAAFYRSTIRSDQRLDYDQVDRLFAGEEPWEEPWATPLRVAREVSAALQAAREREGALAVESAEPEFAFDRRGHVTGSEASEQTESHRLIEHLMIAANEQVARLLADRSVPALHRIHEKPDPTAVERLLDQLASLDLPTPPAPEHLSPREAVDVVAAASRLVDQHVRRTGHGRTAFTYLILRSLKQARYASDATTGHAGLHLDRYCHFTSPIRRYPDLLCHRALLSAVGGGEEAPPAGAMEEAGEHCSARERDAMSIERRADAVARCFLLERELFEGGGFDRVFDGEVTGLIGAGAFVSFGEGHEGLVPVRRLGRGQWWELNEQGTVLEGDDGGAIRLGDPLRVRVERVDAPRGRVDLVLAEETHDDGDARAAGGGAAARRRRRPRQ
ncbi:ribonuclease R family protein [Conexibacter sp. SYSU D00693]|uniref:ribonuclease R family protein n=1 Tax=Conexibacter sp. SYSU D00693 TaxID=2812560 RepID=UPI001F121564|nr:RNB domain-containing ribonuclease [Conexibacter sp. SYSU D00693]